MTEKTASEQMAERIQRGEATTSGAASATTAQRELSSLLDGDDWGDEQAERARELREQIRTERAEAARPRTKRSSVAGPSDRNGEADDARRRQPTTASEQMAARISR